MESNAHARLVAPVPYRVDLRRGSQAGVRWLRGCHDTNAPRAMGAYLEAGKRSLESRPDSRRQPDEGWCQLQRVRVERQFGSTPEGDPCRELEAQVTKSHSVNWD